MKKRILFFFITLFYEITAKGKEELKKAKDFYIKMVKLMKE